MMKIHGANKTNFNPYNDQLQKNINHKSNNQQKDQLEISSEAKKLQEVDKPHEERLAYVKTIKHKVDTGTYEINYDKTAQKMADFWKKP